MVKLCSNKLWIIKLNPHTIPKPRSSYCHLQSQFNSYKFFIYNYYDYLSCLNHLYKKTRDTVVWAPNPQHLLRINMHFTNTQSSSNILPVFHQTADLNLSSLVFHLLVLPLSFSYGRKRYLPKKSFKLQLGTTEQTLLKNSCLIQ